MSIPRLQWGLSVEVPPDATSAWGTRAIVTQDGDVDMTVPGRSDRQGSDKIFGLLEEQFPASTLRAELGRRLQSFQMFTGHGGLHTLYKSSTLTVVANTNGSGGYCYIAAWTTNPEFGDSTPATS